MPLRGGKPTIEVDIFDAQSAAFEQPLSRAVHQFDHTAVRSVSVKPEKPVLHPVFRPFSGNSAFIAVQWEPAPCRTQQFPKVTQMANAGNELEQLTSRLSRLERQNQWLKCGMFSIVAIVGFAVMVAAAPNKEPRIIEAEGFIMRDANGVARVEIGKDGFFINNEDGKHRISIFSGKENGTGIGLFADDTYKRQVILGIQDKLSFCGMTVNDENGKNRIFLNTVKGKPRLELQDETGKPFFTQSQP